MARRGAGMLAAGVLGAWLVSSATLAVGPDTSPLDAHPAYGRARELIRHGDHAAAVRALRIVRAEHPEAADVYNWLGFAHRKLGHRETAKVYYDRALALDPGHLGANAYLGEWHVEAGDLDGARGRLARLVDLCGDCEERRALAAALARAR